MVPDFNDIQNAMDHYVAGEIQHANDEHHTNHVVDAVKSTLLQVAVEVAMELAGDFAMGLVTSGCGLAKTGDHDHEHSPAIAGSAHGFGFTHQTTAFTCAVVSQKMILDQFGVIDPATGEPVSEALLVYEAASHGWLDDHGTSIANMGRLLDHHGIANHHGHDWHHLVKDLSQGHQVLIAVDADHLWAEPGTVSPLHQLFGSSPNHAIVLKGARVDEQGHVHVIVNDPGQPDGAGAEYSLEQFQTALGGGHFHYVATDSAPPGWSPDQHGAEHWGNAPGINFESLTPSDHYLPFDSFASSVDSMSETEKFDLIRSI